MSITEVGATYRYYVTGDFDGGMQLGGELGYLRASVLGLSASGFWAGPMFGAKHTFPFGLTLEGQLGGQYISILSQDQDSEAAAALSGFDLLLNMNLGWSF